MGRQLKQSIPPILPSGRPEDGRAAPASGRPSPLPSDSVFYGQLCRLTTAAIRGIYDAAEREREREARTGDIQSFLDLYPDNGPGPFTKKLEKEWARWAR